MIFRVLISVLAASSTPSSEGAVWLYLEPQWCLVAGAHKACLPEGAKFTRVSSRVVTIDLVAEKSQALVSLEFEYLHEPGTVSEILLKKPFSLISRREVGDLSVAVYSISLGDTPRSTTTSYVINSKNLFGLQITGGDKAFVEELIEDFATSWNRRDRSYPK